MAAQAEKVAAHAFVKEAEEAESARAAAQQNEIADKESEKKSREALVAAKFQLAQASKAVEDMQVTNRAALDSKREADAASMKVAELQNEEKAAYERQQHDAEEATMAERAVRSATSEKSDDGARLAQQAAALAAKFKNEAAEQKAQEISDTLAAAKAAMADADAAAKKAEEATKEMTEAISRRDAARQSVEAAAHIHAIYVAKTEQDIKQKLAASSRAQDAAQAAGKKAADLQQAEVAAEMAAKAILQSAENSEAVQAQKEVASSGVQAVASGGVQAVKEAASGAAGPPQKLALSSDGSKLTFQQPDDGSNQMDAAGISFRLPAFRTANKFFVEKAEDMAQAKSSSPSSMKEASASTATPPGEGSKNMVSEIASAANKLADMVGALNAISDHGPSEEAAANTQPLAGMSATRAAQFPT
eukprot:gnl/TRDRNA2_/TRDRNA2_144936_c0_seq1.p1 gnl/TRDRNA2_/TRDRNA2_144936_c0~~gnl/TRDRNA2_/TRDRNA2_144936_c0_seq1.p1  ORF type:complete len:433 (+),score=145.41 gnl/TRDRNA2_/TRDRNA2_144936_c0_seq1:45-1301(+)